MYSTFLLSGSFTKSGNFFSISAETPIWELKDPKEIAEHVMLIDLGRNDLGRVCEIGTVKVKDLMVIEKYSHVMHIVSQV